MRIARFEPWSYIDLLNRDFGRTAAEDSARTWSPAVDILEEKDCFLLRADLPGVNPADIDISMDAGVLTVSGIRQAEERGEDTAVQRVERASGKFTRRFTLPETVDADGISAKHRNGILEVIIPKQPEMKARKVTVEAA
ncbi:MAG: Hsp20/alpha crystallin family protein [Gammaproteobacteria bacterium]|nr:Hsp20/alpha crystallin family protein [Gammaproteobacteria bacterium]